MSPQTTDSIRKEFSATGIVLPLLLATGVGCVMRGNVDSLEARLREQEGLAANYQRQVADLEQELSVAQREIDLLRRSVSQDGAQLAAFEVHRALAEVVGLRFNSLLTSAQDLDGLPGAERLHAVIYPHDADGEVVKVAGNLSLEAIDPTFAEGERSVGKWEFAASEARTVWHSGFLSTGFLIDAPWSRTPQGTVIILHARFTTPDGRTFDATHTVSRKPESAPMPTRRERSIPNSTSPSSAREPIEFPSESSFPSTMTPTPTPTFHLTRRSGTGAMTFFTSDNWTAETLPVRR